MRKYSRLRTCFRAMIALTSILSTSPALSATNHYYYDPLGRLIGNTAENEQVKSYSYDAADNRSYFQLNVPSGPSSNSISANQYLFRDQALWSADGRYELTLQGDGNLVLYGPSGAIWSTNTSTSSAAILVMQGGGDLVLYDPQYNVLWQTGTSGASSYFVVQTDGNLVVYSSSGTALWASGT